MIRLSNVWIIRNTVTGKETRCFSPKPVSSAFALSSPSVRNWLGNDRGVARPDLMHLGRGNR